MDTQTNPAKRFGRVLIGALGMLLILLAASSAQDTHVGSDTKELPNAWLAPLQLNSFTLGVAVR